jgi:hypothetical protein
MKKILTLLFCLFCVSKLNSQQGYAYAYGREDKNNMSVPVDGGIGLVLVGGITMYSIKKLKKNDIRKISTNNSWDKKI